jgi:ribonuclease Z
MSHLKLIILGASSAIPLSHRYPSAQFLSLANRHFLIDCGEGTQIRLRQENIGFGRIDHILVSHLHGDHFFGLIPLLSTLHLLDRRKPIKIYGPKALKELINSHLSLSNARIGFPIEFIPLDFERKQLIFEDSGVKVHSFPLNHSVPCCGFLFEEKSSPRKMKKGKIAEYGIPFSEIPSIKNGAAWADQFGKLIDNHELTDPPPPPLSYAYCTDTKPVNHLDRYFKGVDLLYHEATFTEEHRERASQTQHSTAAQAAGMAKLTESKHLLLGHFSTRYPKLSDLKEEAAAIFKNCDLVKEGMRIEVFSGDRLPKISLAEVR